MYSAYMVSWKEAYIGWHAGTISLTSLRDIVRFFGIFAVCGRCLDHNPLGLPLMLEHTFRDNRNRAFGGCLTRTSWLQLYCQLQLHHRSGELADNGWRTNWKEERWWRALFPTQQGRKDIPLYKFVILAQCAEVTSRLLSRYVIEWQNSSGSQTVSLRNSRGSTKSPAKMIHAERSSATHRCQLTSECAVRKQLQSWRSLRRIQLRPWHYIAEC